MFTTVINILRWLNLNPKVNITYLAMNEYSYMFKHTCVHVTQSTHNITQNHKTYEQFVDINIVYSEQ